VIFTVAPYAEGGTLLAFELAQRLKKPWQHVARDAPLITLGGPIESPPGILSSNAHAARLRAFLSKHQVRRLNVAGPRASQEPEIAAYVHDVLQRALNA
ncbi:MAG: putative molybdenum carrier protein, partial [Pirellulales bacterium]